MTPLHKRRVETTGRALMKENNCLSSQCVSWHVGCSRILVHFITQTGDCRGISLFCSFCSHGLAFFFSLVLFCCLKAEAEMTNIHPRTGRCSQSPGTLWLHENVQTRVVLAMCTNVAAVVVVWQRAHKQHLCIERFHSLEAEVNLVGRT